MKHIGFHTIIIPSGTGSIDPNLIAWWKMNEGSGQTVTDDSGNGNDLRGTGIGWGTGYMDLNGSQTYISASNASFGNLSNGDISFCMWIKRPATNELVFFDKGTYAGNGYSISSYSGGTIRVAQQTGDIFSTAGFSDTNWHFVVVTVKHSTAEFIIYFDGVFDSSHIWYLNTDSTTTLSVGAYPTYAPVNWFGQLDDGRIYNKVLTSTEVATLYSNGRQ